ncbi:enoyl-CoA hydratase-related protein [Aliiglaciecola sp. 3_MG-2023]|uniref:enoyl-CoA hydratase-related protein n=1 Tax=Aliiglaciecola sp. 3_MG-2023 TaxID=3062644 RepID=UPI0026E39D97|nr:enoyl-CoA hydratase-related protein [Aliiglaciecola sp. 3_MG-2023]MDO6691672.1 enoyl-CoA hydratase-related protein [Aliiglaciecola sp. 3_MG-2023]
MQEIITTLENNVLTLTFNRPAQKNAINQQMYSELANGLERSLTDDEIHCVLIRAEGDTFTAGNDLKDFLQQKMTDASPVQLFLRALPKMNKPLIAAVNGQAIGVGLTMLLHCDIVLASQSATFTAPFTKLGLVPEAGSSILLPNIVGHAIANDILLAGRTLNSEEALSYGLVSRVTTDDNLQALAAEVSQHIVRLPVNAMMKSKALIRNPQREEIVIQMTKESIDFVNQLESEEFKQAVAPFFKKK